MTLYRHWHFCGLYELITLGGGANLRNGYVPDTKASNRFVFGGLIHCRHFRVRNISFRCMSQSRERQLLAEA